LYSARELAEQDAAAEPLAVDEAELSVFGAQAEASRTTAAAALRAAAARPRERRIRREDTTTLSDRGQGAMITLYCFGSALIVSAFETR
jgi:hypothetical protein